MEGDCNVYAHSSLWMRPTRPDRYNAKMVYTCYVTCGPMVKFKSVGVSPHVWSSMNMIWSNCNQKTQEEPQKRNMSKYAILCWNIKKQEDIPKCIVFIELGK